MTFLHPEFLYLMLPGLFVLFYFLLTQREASTQYFSEEVFNRLRVHANMMTLKARNALFLLMFIFLIVALAQPVIEEGKVTVQAKSADIMIALDISDSMLAEDVYPSRIGRAKQKIIGLLERSPQERLGVSAFARASYLVAPLSFDHSAVRFLVKQLQPSFITEKGTDFMALLEASSQMMKENEKKYLLLFTDGGDQEDFDAEIALAKREGITVFVLGIGTEKGAPIKERERGFVKQHGSIVVTKLNKAISKLATETGGVYIESVTSDEDIGAMLAEIAAKTTKRTLKEEEINRYSQLFYFPLGIGMLLLLIATSSMSPRKRLQMPNAMIFFLFLVHGVPSQAGLLDFTLLDDAKSAYAGGDYNRSAALYGEYASRHRSNESLYNTANALYKEGRYADAAKKYEQVQFTEKEKQFDVLHNLGNAYAKQGKPDALEKALETYQKALALKEEQPTRDNFEAVKRVLEQQKQQNQQQQQQQQQQDQGEQKQQQNQSGQKGEQQNPNAEQKNGSDAAKGDDNQSAQSDSEEQKSSSSQQQKQERNASRSGDDTARPESAQQKSDRNASEAQNESSGEKQQTSRERQPEAAQAQQHKSAKTDSGAEAGKGKEAAAAEAEPEMSDLEAQKWLKMLNDRPVSHIYRIGPQQKPQRESENEKPW